MAQIAHFGFPLLARALRYWIICALEAVSLLIVNLAIIFDNIHVFVQQPDQFRKPPGVVYALEFSSKIACSICRDNDWLILCAASLLRYHGWWIFKKNAKNLFFAVQIENTEKNNLQKEWRKKLCYFYDKEKNCF